MIDQDRSMRVRSAFAAIALAFGTIFIACSSSSPSSPSHGGSGKGGGSNGGGSGTAGSAGASGAHGSGEAKGGGGAAGGSSKSSSNTAGGSSESCEDVKPCGGDVLGEWTVKSSCLKLDGDFSMAGLLSCPKGTVTASLNVTGSWTAKSKTSYSDKTNTTGDFRLELPKECLDYSGTKLNCDGLKIPLGNGLNIPDMVCETVEDTGGCDCSGTVDQKGSAPFLSSSPSDSGTYATADNTLTLDGSTKQSYCVSGKNMTWTPKDWNAEFKGSITFEKSGATSGGGGGAAGGSSTGAGGNSAGAAGHSTPGAGGKTGGVGGATGKDGGTPGKDSGSAGTGGSTSTGGGDVEDRPCDIYAAANMPCAAAYSMVRRLSKSYTGPLYQVRNGSSNKNQGSGGKLQDILQTDDGYADTAAQDTFCADTVCTVATLYDQSGNKNDLKRAPKGNTAGGATGGEDDYESSATKGSVTAGGHKVYSLYMDKHEGYRTAVGVKGKGMPMGSDPQTVYELADGTHVGDACCWDFGNVTTDATKYGIMNTLFFGTAYWGKGAGNGPWFMADFEAGVWAGGSKKGDPGWGALDDDHPINSSNPALKVAFAFGVLKTSSSKWALRMADSQQASDLTTGFEGGLPKSMDNLGGIVLGVGGDNSNNSFGTFFEGAIVAGYTANDTDLAVMKNVKAAGYKK